MVTTGRAREEPGEIWLRANLRVCFRAGGRSPEIDTHRRLRHALGPRTPLCLASGRGSGHIEHHV